MILEQYDHYNLLEQLNDAREEINSLTREKRKLIDMSNKLRAEVRLFENKDEYSQSTLLLNIAENITQNLNKKNVLQSQRETESQVRAKSKLISKSVQQPRNWNDRNDVN
jgi:hypothetical protein